MRAPLALAVAAAHLACGELCLDAETSAPHLRFELPAEAPDFFAHPFPSNLMRREDGTLKLSRFPNPPQSSTLKDYLEVIGEESKGFGQNAAIYMSLSAPLDPASLPADPLSSTAAGASLFLVDVDPASAQRGRRIPIQIRASAEGTQYLPPNHLIALPPYGIPLRPNTSYALIGTTALKDAAGERFAAPRHLHNALRATCRPQAPPSVLELFAPLLSWLDEAEDVDPADVAVATVFTTHDALGEMRRIGEAAHALPAPLLTNLTPERERDEVRLIRGTIQMPSFQSGKVPYTKQGDGGAIAWGPDGLPVVDHTETTRVGFMIPKGPMPASGWPTVLMSHGTGADYKSAFSAEVASVLATRGIAVVSYDPTLHGPRDPTGSNEDLTFFNLFNIIAGRDNVRQGAVDCVVMTTLIRSGLELPSHLNGGTPARFDRERVAFLGHSQGGLVGSGCVAIEPAFKAAVFSGTSGLLTITLLERKSPVDFLALIKSLLSIPDGEPMDDFHPILNLLQTFIEPADPITYAPSYIHEPPRGARRDILYIEGFHDSASPARGHEALATAAGAPLVAPFFRVPAAAQLEGPSPHPAPAEANVDSPVGPITIGLIQYPEQDHWPIFYDHDANARYVEFLRSALFDGRARIIPSAR